MGGVNVAVVVAIPVVLVLLLLLVIGVVVGVTLLLRSMYYGSDNVDYTMQLTTECILVEHKPRKGDNIKSEKGTVPIILMTGML